MFDYVSFFIGAMSMLGMIGFVVACASLSAHKRNRLLIRRMTDEIHKRAGTIPVRSKE